ncbi:phage tail protein [Myceligenerans crystallogenes]|uniref:Phage tail protein (Tail_P2_I) n=1 Tax=Myceligenerans crystallogenes TaxID=316335 RepID=A0ABN2N9H1_9MICO
MTVSDLRRAGRARYLESLLPPHVLERDAATGGLLRALLDAVAGELAVVEDDLDTLYDAWFVETAPEWVLPYLADLVGLAGLPGDLGAGTGAGVSRRGVVANTVMYRQRKGTVAVLEQVVRDVTGWPAAAIEHHPLLGVTTHVNHVRPDRPAWASVRGAAQAELESPRLAAGALTRFAHTAEARHVDPGPAGGRGRFGIGNVGIFVFGSQVYGASGTPARRPLGGADGWATHPLGLDEPWFAPPATEEHIEHLAGEADLPVPLRPRRLLALLRAARAGGDDAGLPVRVRLDDDAPLPAERVRVCRLEDLATDDAGDPLTGWQVTVDPVHGRIRTLFDGAPADPGSVHVDYAYGAPADVGAGTYDRSLGHDAALAADPFTGDTDEGGDRVGAQVPVRTGATEPGTAVSIADGLADVAAGWSPAAPDLTGGTQVLSVADSETYTGDLTIDVPAESRLVLVAAHWRGRLLLTGDVEAPVPGVYAPDGLRPRVVGDVLVTGQTGAAVLLDGLVIEGDVVVAAGDLRSLTVSQCTVAGRVRVLGTPADGNRELVVDVRRSLVGGVELAPTAPGLRVTDSVVDPRLTDPGAAPPAAGPAVVAPGTHVTVEGSTLLGALGARVLHVTSSLCDGVVTVVDRQRGCARFSYLAPGSRAPRRFRCVPPGDAPTYLARDPAAPAYPALAPTAPASIRRGGEDGAEMGVHHHLRRPQRTDAARRLVEPYVPAAMRIGMLGS